MSTPFLLKFARPCLAPNRNEHNKEYIYDYSDDLVHWLGNEYYPIAIELSGKGGPQTKKDDIEKGEDNKDRRMWE